MNFEDIPSSVLGLAIKDSLANHNIQNAVYLAERQFQMSQSEDSRMQLAECYTAANKNHLAIDLLQGTKLPRGKYLLALCYFNISEYDKAEQTLLNCSEKLSRDILAELR